MIFGLKHPDRLSVTPEPEPSGELRSEPDTGGGDSQYSVIDNIGVTQQTQSVKLPDFSSGVYGQLIVRDPEAEVSDHGGAVLSHIHEIQAVSTGGGGDINTENTSHIPVTQQPVVMVPTLSDRDGRDLETGSPGPGSGAGHEERDTHHDIDSSLSGHRDDDGGHLHSSATQTICD